MKKQNRGNRTSGREDITKPFGERRRLPGMPSGRLDGRRLGMSAASWAFQNVKDLVEAARLAETKFGLSPKLTKMVLSDDSRNSVKLMRLVSLCEGMLRVRKARRERRLCTRVARLI